MTVPNVPVRIITHAKKVCSLYKRAYRNLESTFSERTVLRYEATVLRSRFDKNKDIRDNIKAVQLLAEGEKELHAKQHYQPIKFANDYGGLTWCRDSVIPDWVVDYWHPLEKAQYPEYFARREQRKKEYIQWWKKTYKEPINPDSHH
ncbi:NADH dehydrogenase (ubiquinone) B22 subunit [Lycorma delicatula]|uniref:NADH dehydrogenase (ubiquinone) B22 subunit n=1 Tax=Lycorma delicatula TaxID=130591 RepID=UPI003F51A4C6